MYFLPAVVAPLTYKIIPANENMAAITVIL